MNPVSDFLSEARTAHARREWAASYGALVRVDGLASMTPADRNHVSAWTAALHGWRARAGIR